MRVRASLRKQAIRHMAKMTASLEGVHDGVDSAASCASGSPALRTGLNGIIPCSRVLLVPETKGYDCTTLQRRHSESLLVTTLQRRHFRVSSMSVCSLQALRCR